MIVANDPDVVAVGNVDDFGLALFQYERGSYHIGMLYSGEDTTRVRHLAWNYYLKDEPFEVLRNSEPMENAGVVWTDCSIEKTTKFALAEWLAAIDLDKIPYGIDFQGQCFGDDHHYITPGIGQGLTCATYVLGFLNSWKVFLLDLEDWPGDRPADLRFQDWVVQQLNADASRMERKSNFSAHVGAWMRAHADAMRRFVGGQRVRPEEVLVAASTSPHPSKFDDIEKLVEETIEAIDCLLKNKAKQTPKQSGN